MSKFEQDLRNVMVQELSSDYASLVDVSIAPAIFKNDAGQLMVSAESGLDVADYYGEFRGELPWIHPAIEAVAKKHGMYCEWENAGVVSFSS